MKFDIRVMGIPNHLATARHHLSRPDFQLEQAKFKAAEAALIERLPDDQRAITELFKRRHNVVSHFRCERFKFLEPLHDFACFIDGTTPEEVIEENTWTASLNIVMMGHNDSLLVPYDFSVPMLLDVVGRDHPYVVCSAVRIARELDNLNEYVAVEETLGMNDFGDFVNFSRDAMDRFEQQEGVGRRFWAKWGVMALRGAVTRSLEHRVCAIVDPQFSEVPVGA